MTTRLAHARRKFDRAQHTLNEARATMREIALGELRRGVSASRVAKELNVTRSAVSKWAREAAIRVEHPSPIEPRKLDE